MKTFSHVEYRFAQTWMWLKKDNEHELPYSEAVSVDFGQTGKIVVSNGRVVWVGRGDVNFIVIDRICCNGQASSLCTRPISH